MLLYGVYYTCYIKDRELNFNLTLTDQLICLLINKILILRIVFDLRALKGNLLSSKTAQFHVYVVEEQKQALVPSMLELFPDLKKTLRANFQWRYHHVVYAASHNKRKGLLFTNIQIADSCSTYEFFCAFQYRHILTLI